MGTIKALCISEKKGTLKTPVHKALFQTEWGMVGDAHAGRWHRQVSFLGLAEIEAFRKRGIDVKLGAFGENIVAEGFHFKELPVGTRLRAGEVATTSQLNSDYLYGQMKKHLQNGDDVLYLAFSSGLSGTCSNGMLAANELRGEFPERKLTVVDTLCPSLMEGMLAIMTAERLERTGEDVDALAAWVETIKPRLNAWFTVDDLKFLKRGGRISAASAAIGTML